MRARAEGGWREARPARREGDSRCALGFSFIGIRRTKHRTAGVARGRAGERARPESRSFKVGLAGDVSAHRDKTARGEELPSAPGFDDASIFDAF